MKIIDELPPEDRPVAKRATSSFWGGAALSNLCVIASGGSCLILGAVGAAALWLVDKLSLPEPQPLALMVQIPPQIPPRIVDDTAVADKVAIPEVSQVKSLPKGAQMPPAKLDAGVESEISQTLWPNLPSIQSAAQIAPDVISIFSPPNRKLSSNASQAH